MPNFRFVRLMACIAVSGLVLFQLGANVGSAKVFAYARAPQIQRKLLSGLAEYELNAQNAANTAQLSNVAPAAASNTAGAGTSLSNDTPQNYFPNANGNCPEALGTNIKVNQNCLNLTDADLQGRAQANNETSIAQDPNNPDHLVASYNDYRRGDGNCYAAYSLNGGRGWSDTTIPMGFTRGTAFGAAREYWNSGGDTSVAWDTKGNAYLSCQVFNRGAPTTPNPDVSSAFYIFRSTQNNGASWNFTGRPVAESSDTTAADAPFEDKQLMTIDTHVGSPFQDRVYVTWTEFAADGSAYIWESYSADYGETFSPRVLVSKDSRLCVNDYGLGTPQGKCNENQFSQPFTGPDGALYVTWANFNNATGHPIDDGDDNGGGDGATTNAATNPNDNHNQMLLAKSTDGGKTFKSPVKVADYYDLPDCATYQNGQDAGRACVPEKGTTANSIFRATNYPVGATNPTNPKQVIVTFGSYINAHSNEDNGCAPAGFSPDTGISLYTGVKTVGACNNDILVSVSNDSGATFTGKNTDPRKLTSVNQQRRQATTDQWWQWATFTNAGRLAVSFYDRQYGDDELTGYSDVSLAGSDDLPAFSSRRVTSDSMPPPTQFSGVFFGDYTGLSALNNNAAFPIWMDTRNPDLFRCPGTGTSGHAPTVCTATAPNAMIANDQDAFVRRLSVPH